MSVIGFTAEEIKSLEVAAVELCGPHVGGNIWPMLYVANRRAYCLRYLNRDLKTGEYAAYRAEYARSLARCEFAPKSAADLFRGLKALFYSCENFDPADEKNRRMVLASVAFELLPTDGGPALHLENFANIQRLDFDHYQISTVNPEAGHYGCPYQIDGHPHPLEGFTTTNPLEAFQRMWELNDACSYHYHYCSSAELAELHRLIFEEGKTYAAARLELLGRKSAAS